MPDTVALSATVRGSLRVYPIDFAREYGVDAFFTDRTGGVSSAPFDTLNLAQHVGDRSSDVEENRTRLAHASGVERQRLVFVNQVHGADVAHITGLRPGVAADALVTEVVDLAVVVLVADCVPVLLVTDAREGVAVVHAGWRGLHLGVLTNAVRALGERARVHAFVGPAISGAAYQVGPDVARYFRDVPGALSPDVDDRSRLDLRTVAAHQLAALGVSDDHVRVSRETTDGGSIFFSDRAQRPCGRFALVAKRSS